MYPSIIVALSQNEALNAVLAALFYDFQMQTFSLNITYEAHKLLSQKSKWSNPGYKYATSFTNCKHNQ